MTTPAVPAVPAVGSIGWVDLTVADAGPTRAFYEAVVGWTALPLDMGGYADFVMQQPADGAAVAGVCHARGANAAIPPHWIVYFTVADLDASLAAVRAHGGRVVAGPRSAGKGTRFCIIEDPAGAVAAIVGPDAAAGS